MVAKNYQPTQDEIEFRRFDGSYIDNAKENKRHERSEPNRTAFTPLTNDTKDGLDQLAKYYKTTKTTLLRKEHKW